MTEENDPLEGVVIPSKPSILIDIQRAANNTEKLIELIEQDTGISASVLKAINSPYYALRVTITSIQKAVMLLGIDTVITLVNSLALRGCLNDQLGIPLEAFWDSSMDVAKAAGSIATQTKLCNRDTAYALGLFHNCGIPILMQKNPNYMDIVRKSYADPKGNIVKIERDVMNLDHAFVGAKLCQMWNLSEKLIVTIRYHHHGKAFLESTKFGDEIKKLGAVLMLAEHIARVHETLGGQEEDFAWKINGKMVLDVLDMSSEAYENVKEYIWENIYT